MKKGIITIVVLASSAVAGLVLWIIFDDKIFSGICGIVTIVSVLYGIYISLSGKDIVVEYKKQIEDKEKRIEDKERQIKQLEELREYDKKNNIELNAQIEKLLKEKDKLRKEKNELEIQLKQTEKIIEQNKKKDIKKQSSLYKKAYNLFLKGNIEKALNVLSIENLEKYDDADLWFLRAELLWITGNYDEIIKCYKKIVEIKPNCFEAYYEMGMAYQHKHNLDKAVECLDKAIEINPLSTDAYDMKYLICLFKGDYNEAIDCYNDRLIKIKSNDSSSVYNNIGIAYRRKGDYDKAIEYYEKSIDWDKGNPAHTYKNMGNVYYDKGNYDKAIGCYEKAIELEPDYEDAYHNMGLAHQYLGNEDKANDCFQKASMIRHNISFTEYKEETK